MVSRQHDLTLRAYWAGDVDRLDTHIEAAEAFEWAANQLEGAQ